MIKQEKMDQIISFSDVYSEYLPQKFGFLVSQARKEKQISQRQLSEALSVSQGWVSRIESGASRSIKNVDLLIRLWDILDLPDPDDIPSDELPPEILNLIKVLVRHGETMPPTAIKTLIGVADLVLRYGANPHIVIPNLVDTDIRRKWLPNEYSWQLRPFANYMYYRLHDQFDFDRLTIQRVLKINVNGEVMEIPETYTSGSATFLVHYQNAIEEVFGKETLESGGVFKTSDVSEAINNSIRKNEDIHNRSLILVPIYRNRQQRQHGSNVTGEVKVFFYRDKPFEYRDYLVARSVVQQFFLEVDERHNAQQKLGGS